MTTTQKCVIRFCEENNLVITEWNKVDETTGEIIVVKDMPNIEEGFGALAHVKENSDGIKYVNSFFTTKNINRSHPVLYVGINGKRVKVKR